MKNARREEDDGGSLYTAVDQDATDSYSPYPVAPCDSAAFLTDHTNTCQQNHPNKVHTVYKIYENIFRIT